jgi:hypothetical protein
MEGGQIRDTEVKCGFGETKRQCDNVDKTKLTGMRTDGLCSTQICLLNRSVYFAAEECSRIL